MPYNPGLSHQMAFYSRRMREEASIRRIGTVFIFLTFLIQFFAILSPPQPTVAASSNDLINGGISSAADAKRNCSNNVQHYRDIMAYYGVSCADIGRATTTTLHSTGNNYYSMGRLPYGQRNPTSGKVTNETPVNIPGAGRLYLRKLSSFDTGPSSAYKALHVHSSVTGKSFYILYNCGNLVAIGLPQPVQTCKYDASLPADSPKCAAPCKYNPSILSTSSRCVAPCPYNKLLPADSPNCFAHCPLPGKTNLPQNSPLCKAACPYNKSLPADSPNCFQPCQYNKNIPSSSPDCHKTETCPYNSSLTPDSPLCFQACQYDSSISSSDANCKPCEQSVSSQDATACVVVHKTASNITAGISDANGTQAHPGDVITYTLFAQNNGKATVKDFVFLENLSDVLDYADAGDLHGGSINADKVVTWPAEDIKAGATAKHQITIKVKDPVPQTPTSTSDPGHFDLVMTNVYGDTVNINLPGSPTKQVETAAATLPNTGPGTSLLIAASLVIVSGYFWARARLLADEAMLAVHESTSGGMV